MRLNDPLANQSVPRGIRSALSLVLAGTVLPHLAHLPLAIMAFGLAGLTWGLVAQYRSQCRPGRAQLTLLAIAGLALLVLTVPLSDGRLAGTSLLVMMLGLKQLESNSRRDHRIGILLGLVVVLTQFLFDQSLPLALYLFSLTALLLGLQVALSGVSPRLGEIARTTALLFFGGLPLAAALFLFFPRLDHPLWAISHGGVARTGVSGQMRLGQIGELARSEAVAFRVTFDGPPPPRAALYWRGPVLWRFDGRAWHRDDPKTPPAAVRTDPNARIHYRMTVEPSGRRWLFPLDLPMDLPPGVQIDADFQVRAPTVIEERQQLSFGSAIRYRLPGLSPRERRAGLALPEGFPQRVRALARDWRRRHPDDDAAVVRAALNHFHRQPFVYTLRPGRAEGDPTEDFLFRSRRGFCEYYASAFTLLMRAAGIPARIVTGYQGGTRNPLADHWVVRQSDAHAWAEVWLEDQGWTRVDPTAAVAPERIETAIDPVSSQQTDAVVFGSTDSAWLRRLARQGRWLLDALDQGWYLWVVGLDQKRQHDLLARLGLDRLGPYAEAVIVGVLFLLLGLTGWLMSRLPHASDHDPAARLWADYRRRLQKAGLAAPDWLGPRSLLQRARQRWPDQAATLDRITHEYLSQRYGPRPDPGRLRQLRRLIRRLRLPSDRHPDHPGSPPGR